MSMNFGREQSLLRQRLTAVGSAAAAAALQPELGQEITCLGAPAEEVKAAATTLLATYPQMGRAQMTAFVRTLWQAKIHELRAVGVEILATRAGLLEAADLPLLEKLLGDDSAAVLVSTFADAVLGSLVARHKKLWKDLERFVKSGRAPLRRAAVAACREPVLTDAGQFARFQKLVEPLLADADAGLQQEIDRVLTAIGSTHGDAVRDFAERHGRKLKLPKAAARTAAKILPAARPTPRSAPTGKKPAAGKATAPKKVAKKAVKKTTRKS